MKNINVFDMVKPNDNLIIADMSKNDLEEFLFYLNQYMLIIREHLSLNNNITFGLEFEIERVNIREYRKILANKDFADWKFKTEGTLFLGKEVVSSILRDEFNTWSNVSLMLDNLAKFSDIIMNAAGHIHFGAQILGTNIKHYKNLIKLWIAYENIIFRFGYGEFLTERRSIGDFAWPLLNRVDSLDFDWDKFFNNKLNALSYFNLDQNLIESYNECIDKHTIEVRSPNGSLNPIIWQNNINFFANLFLYAKSLEFNESLIDNRIKQLIYACKEKGEIECYRQIDLESAIELADLIFDKNIDKVYFLRQYIKSNEVGSYCLEKGTKFTKCKNY